MKCITFVIKNIYFFFFIILFSCRDENNPEIQIFKALDWPKYPNYIFLHNNKFTLLRPRDSTEVKFLNENEIISYGNRHFFKLKNNNSLDFESIEGSNYQGGSFYLDYNFNYDFKLDNNSIIFNIDYPNELKNTYKINLSTSELNLFKNSIANFGILKSDSSLDNKFNITIKFLSKRKKNYFIKDISNIQVSLFYSSINYILIQHLLYKKDYTILKKPISVSTSKGYYAGRNPPIFPIPEKKTKN
jgi:hypothetical protein